MLNLASLPQFHTKWLENIRKSVKASNVCYVRYRDGYFIRIIKDGDETRFELTGTPLDVTRERYAEFKDLAVDYYSKQ